MRNTHTYFSIKTTRKLNRKHLGIARPYAYLTLKQANENTCAFINFLKGRDLKLELWIIYGFSLPPIHIDAYLKSWFIDYQ